MSWTVRTITPNRPDARVGVAGGKVATVRERRWPVFEVSAALADGVGIQGPSVPRCCRSRWLGRCPGGECCRLRSFSALPRGRRTAAGKGCRMRREWEPEDLLGCWTLMDPGRPLLATP